MLSEPEWQRQNKQTKTTTSVGIDMGKEECSYIVSGSVKPEKINRSYFIMYSIEFTLSVVFIIIKMTNLDVIWNNLVKCR